MDPAELQMNYIVHEIGPCCEKIKGLATENEQFASLAHETWKIANKMLDQIVHTRFGGDDSKLIILGGIQINMPRPFDDLFQPLTFDVRSKDGTITDLYQETFGHPSPIGLS